MPANTGELGSERERQVYRQSCDISRYCCSECYYGLLDLDAATTDGAATSYAKRQEDRSSHPFRGWFGVSEEASLVEVPKLTLRRTLVTSIIRLVLMIPMVQNVDQTWVVSVPCIWM